MKKEWNTPLAELVASVEMAAATSGGGDSSS